MDLKAAASIIASKGTADQHVGFTNDHLRSFTNEDGFRFTLYQAPPSTAAVLDIAKVADIVVPVMCPNEEGNWFDVDERGQHLIDLVQAQGLPSVVGVLQGLSKLSARQKPKVAKHCKRKLVSMLPPDSLNIKVWLVCVWL